MVSTSVTARIVDVPASGRRRAARFAMVVLWVALAHTLALQGGPGVQQAQAAPLSAAAPVQVRVVAAAQPDAPEPETKPRRAEAPKPAVPRRPAEAPVLLAAAAPAAAAEPTVIDAAPLVAAAALAGTMAGDIEVPVYHTRMPPALHWAYELRRGFISGRGDLVWSPARDRYDAKLEGRVAGFVILDWVSRGAIDAAGAAPERFVIRRKGREHQAANFQRDAGKITYSGPQTEHPLPAGAQDRLSFLLQLAGIVAADPQRFSRSDEHIRLFVSGARGDAGVWTFDVLGVESIHTPLGPVQALHLRREPLKPRDTSVDVWLDPARHHGPVRAELRNPGDGDPLELLLADENPSS
jgi:Protein of unknown function (DUF3108)